MFWVCPHSRITADDASCQYNDAIFTTTATTTTTTTKVEKYLENDEKRENLDTQGTGCDIQTFFSNLSVLS